MLKNRDKVLSLRWVHTHTGPKVIVTRWQDGRRKMSLEELPFKPYGFVKTDAPALHSQGILGFEKENTDLKTIQGEKLSKVSVTIPKDIRTLRDNNPDVSFYESDIPYGKRVFLDLDLQLPNEYVPCYLDIEIDPRNIGANIMKKFNKQVLSVAFSDGTFVCDDDEQKVFAQVEKKIQNYTVLCSWSDFDFVYLRGRSLLMGYNTPFIRQSEGIDLMHYFAQLVLKKYTHSFVKLTKAVEKMNQLGVKMTMRDFGLKQDYNLVYEYFKHKRLKLKEYNLEDAIKVREIDKALQLGSSLYEIMKLIGIFPEQFLHHSNIVDQLMLRLARKRGLVLPNKKPPTSFIEYKKQKNKPKGGKVFEPKEGYHKNVICLDFTGLYPSIMHSLNIGLDVLTKCGDEHHKSVFKSAKAGKCYKKTPKSLNNELLDWVQDKYEEYTKELNNATPNSIDEARAYIKRFKMKVIRNADFGVTGFRTYRLYNEDVFESTTLTGQEMITKAAEILGDVLYGDTDSLFLQISEEDAKDLKGFVDKLTERVNIIIRQFSIDRFGAPIETEFELDYYCSDIYFTNAKKRYVARVKWEKQPCDYIKVTGFETKRRDWTSLAKEVQQKIFVQLLSGITAKELELQERKYFLQMKKDVFSGKLDDKIMFVKGLKREISEYKTDLPHTRAAKILQDLGRYQPGRDIEYYVVSHDKKTYRNKAGKKMRKDFIETYPNIESRPDISPSGYMYVWQSQVLAILDRLGLYKGDEIMKVDPGIKLLDNFFGEFMRL